MNKKNIVICGGHLTPALAVIENLLREKDYKIFYFGRRRALEGDEAESLEYHTINKLDIPFKSVISARLQRAFTIHTIPALTKFPAGLVQSLFLLFIIRPKVIVSFGGYVALPVCLSAWILRIPIITHEQTHHLGLANRIIARLARVLCLSFEDTGSIPGGIKTLVTGNPIRNSLIGSNNKKILDFGDKQLPLIFITGGNLGARVINETIGKILPELCGKYRVFHQCGNAENGKDFRILSRLKSQLPVAFRNNYRIRQQIDPSDIGSIYISAALVIGRAGANTVNEILFFCVPAILIPLPWAGQNEQEKNAMSVKSIGLGEIIKQSELTPQLLNTKIEAIIKSIATYRQNGEKNRLYMKKDTAEQIVRLIATYSTR